MGPLWPARASDLEPVKPHGASSSGTSKANGAPSKWGHYFYFSPYFFSVKCGPSQKWWSESEEILIWEGVTLGPSQAFPPPLGAPYASLKTLIPPEGP